jgi:hypothetical protein
VKLKATITDTQRLDMVKQFTRWNPFVIQRGQDPRKVMDVTIMAAKQAKQAAAVLIALATLTGCASASPVTLTCDPVPSAASYTVYVVAGNATNQITYSPNTSATWTVIVCSSTLNTPRSAWPIYAQVENAVTNTCLFTNLGSACFF